MMGSFKTTEFAIALATIAISAAAAAVFVSWYPIIGCQIIACVYVLSRMAVKKEKGTMRVHNIEVKR